MGDRTTPESLAGFWRTSMFMADGQAQETCRDFGHTSWGIAAAINTAETALQQGVDLYAAESRRLRAGLEFHAGYINGEPVPSWLCGGRVRLATLPTWEIAFNHFTTRLGLSLPNTQTLIAAQCDRAAPTTSSPGRRSPTRAWAGPGSAEALRPRPKPRLVVRATPVRSPRARRFFVRDVSMRIFRVSASTNSRFLAVTPGVRLASDPIM